MQELIDQIISRIPDLTTEQVSKMNSAFLPIPEIVEADVVAGEATATAMAQLADDVDAGVYAVARTGILGICAKGLVPDEVSATLLRVWTAIVEPLEETRSEPVVETSRYGFGITADPSAVLEGDVKSVLELNFEQTKERAFPEWNGNPEYNDEGLTEVDGKEVRKFTWVAEVLNACILAIPLTTEEVIAKENALDETPHAPTEEELADLGAPNNEANEISGISTGTPPQEGSLPAVEIGYAEVSSVSNLSDIQEGEISPE